MFFQIPAETPPRLIHAPRPPDPCPKLHYPTEGAAEGRRLCSPPACSSAPPGRRRGVRGRRGGQGPPPSRLGLPKRGGVVLACFPRATLADGVWGAAPAPLHLPLPTWRANHGLPKLWSPELTTVWAKRQAWANFDAWGSGVSKGGGASPRRGGSREATKPLRRPEAPSPLGSDSSH